MRLYELLANVETLSRCSDREITEVVSDSRKAAGRGILFVAIAGEHFDGHDCCADLLRAGAAAVVVERDMGLADQIVVRDTRAALNRITAAFYGDPADSFKLLGITGTSGKTSTAFMVKNLCDSMGVRCGLIGTVKCIAGEREFEAGQTTPEPAELQRMFKLMQAERCEYVVMEVSSQGLAQGRVDGLHFVSAGFTNFSQDHLDYHNGSMQEYLNAKKALFSLCDAASTNADDPKGREAVERFEGKPLTISTLGQGDLNASEIVTGLSGTSFTLEYHGCKRPVKMRVLGSFAVYNAMSAAALLLGAGFDFEAICRGFSAVRTIPGRLEQLPSGRDFTVLLDYAHKPDAIEKVLKTVRGFAPGRIVIVFGCGGDRDRLKRPIMGRIAEQLADYVYVTSDNPRHEVPEEIISEIVAGMSLPEKRTVICDRREAIRRAIADHLPGDVIILAGKGHETYQKIGDSVLHFDEREIVAQILAETV